MLTSVRILDRVRNFPIYLTLLVIASIALGLFTIYDSSGGQIMTTIFQKQLIYSALFFVLMVVIAVIDIKFFFTYAYVFYGLSIALLLAVNIAGYKAMGATRWLNLVFIRIQPSELVKVSLVLALARYFHFKNITDNCDFKQLIVPFILFFIPFVIILRQPDLGTALTLLAISGMIFFLAGVRARYFLIALALTALSCPILMKYLHDYQKKRIMIFLSPESDPLGAGYNIIQSKIAIGSGGLWGKGKLLSTQARLDFLPEYQTDFIFSLFAEEQGFIGALILIGIFLATIVMGVYFAMKSKHQFGKLLAFGLISVFSVNAVINLGMVTGLLPVVGIPLPFLSYGGSSIATILASFGILINVRLNYNVALPTKLDNL